jgi:DNA-3-methyladenine glycosylase
VLARGFFARPALEVAPGLLGCVIEHDTPDGLVAAVLTEVEAYEGAADPASHAYRGRSARNAVMFGPAGHAYVYFTYGMHFCVNLVCLPEGTASAVLLRAGRVIEGIPLAARRRSAAVRRPPPRGDEPGGEGPGGEEAEQPRVFRERDLASGPARLCQALGVGRALNGADVCDPASPLRIRSAVTARHDGVSTGVSTGPRVGVSSAARRPWRFWLAGDPSVSAYRAHVPRTRRKVNSPPDHEDGTMLR